MPWLVGAFGIILTSLMTLINSNISEIKNTMKSAIEKINTHDTSIAVLGRDVKAAHSRLDHHEEAHA